jgi:uncharacterized membrane protein (UPF0127 family)
MVEWDKRKMKSHISVNKKKLTRFVALIVIAGAGYLFLHGGNGARLLHFNQAPKINSSDTPTVTFDSVSEPVDVVLADTDAEREQGLSGRPGLAPNEGMLFIFDTPGRPAFWMKDMLFPLDIIWFSSDWHIVDITQNLPPESYPNTVSPIADTTYVLEVPAGFAAAHHLKINQSATFKK